MKVEVLFSPRGGCESAIVSAIKRANRSIHILAYTFTSKAITDALVARRKANIPIRFIGDDVGMKGPGCQINTLLAAGVECFTDGVHAIAHNKVIIIDEITVIGGSYNFSSAAENRNGENLTITTDVAIAAKYKANWDLHRSHSIFYTPVFTSGATPFEFDPAVETELSQQ